MVAMAERFHNAVPQLSRFAFSRMAAARAFVASLHDQDAAAWCLDVDGVRGALIGQVMQYPLGAELMAKEVVFWIEPDFRGRFARQMISTFEAWAKSKGAVAIGLSCFADGRTHLLFQRAGYRAAEQNMIKDL